MGSERVPKRWDPSKYGKCGIRVSTEKVGSEASTGKVGFGRVPEGKIRVSTGKGRIRASTGNGGIRVSTGKVGSMRVPKRWDPGEYRKRVQVSTGKVGSERVPEKGPSEYRKSRNPREYWKRWDPGEYREGKIRVSTGKGRIRMSTGKVEILATIGKVGSERVPEKGLIRASIGNGGIQVRCWRTRNKLNKVNKLREKG